MAISAATWVPTDVIGLNAQITDHTTTQQHPINHRVKCRDTSSNDRGFADFVYLKGVASTVAGDLVIFEGNGTTIRAAARGEGPCAVAMSACVANEYGWYQLTGRAIITAGTVADNAQLYLTATAGSVDDAHVAGDGILGARSDGATDTGQILATINYPCVADTDDA